MKTLKQKTISGVYWNSLAQLGEELIRIIVIIILARFLTPEAFGLVGMVMVFSGFAYMFTGGGLGEALVQRKEITEKHKSSVFFLSILIGLALTVIFILIAPLIVDFYNSPELFPLTIVLAFNYLISSFFVVQESVLRRELNFRSIAMIRILAVSISGVIGIVMALRGFGVWSIVAQILSFSVFLVIFFLFFSNWEISLLFSWKAIKDLTSFGANLTGFNIFNYWVRNSDKLLVGRLLGSSALGLYSRAYAIMLFPIVRISSVIGKVMFPALSKIQEDKELTKKAYLRTISIIALITFPLMFGLLVTADHFVLALLGENWKEMILLLRIMALIGMWQSVGATVGWIYQAQGRTDWMFRWSVLSGLSAVCAFIIGIRWGLPGITTAYAIQNFSLMYFSVFIPGKLINMSFKDFFNSVSSELGCSLLMAIFVIGVGMSIPSVYPHWLFLVLKIIAGTVIYFSLIKVLRVKSYSYLMNIIREQKKLYFKQKGNADF